MQHFFTTGGSSVCTFNTWGSPTSLPFCTITCRKQQRLSYQKCSLVTQHVSFHLLLIVHNFTHFHAYSPLCYELQNTFFILIPNTIELPLVYFWRGKELWALVRIHSACQKPLTTSSCILHLTLFRPLEEGTGPGNVFADGKKEEISTWVYLSS